MRRRVVGSEYKDHSPEHASSSEGVQKSPRLGMRHCVSIAHESMPANTEGCHCTNWLGPWGSTMGPLVGEYVNPPPPQHPCGWMIVPVKRLPPHHLLRTRFSLFPAPPYLSVTLIHGLTFPTACPKCTVWGRCSLGLACHRHRNAHPMGRCSGVEREQHNPLTRDSERRLFGPRELIETHCCTQWERGGGGAVIGYSKCTEDWVALVVQPLLADDPVGGVRRQTTVHWRRARQLWGHALGTQHSKSVTSHGIADWSSLQREGARRGTGKALPTGSMPPTVPELQDGAVHGDWGWAHHNIRTCGSNANVYISCLTATAVPSKGWRRTDPLQRETAARQQLPS